MEELNENQVIGTAETAQNEVQAETVQAEVAQAQAVEGGEAVKTQKHRKIKIVPLLAYISNAFYLFVQAMIMVLFLTGLAPLFGEGFTIVSCINYIINIFGINLATAYTYICGCVFTVIYIVFIVAMIKALCTSIKSFITLTKITFSKPDEEVANRQPMYLLNIYYPCMRTFFLAFCFMTLANLVSYNALSSSAVNCMVFAGICTVLNVVIPQLSGFSKERIPVFVISTVKELLGYIIVCLLISYVNQTVLKDLINGFIMLIGGNMINEGSEAKAVIYAVYCNIASPILFIVLASQTLGLINKYFARPTERNVTGAVISQLIFTGIYMVLHLVFKLILVVGAFDISMIGDWLNIMKDSLVPIFLLLVTLLLVEIPFKVK